MINKKIKIINGPNLNLLGTREPDIYGGNTLVEIENMIKRHVKENSYFFDLDFFQSNSEGEIVESLQDAGKNCDGVIVNAGGLTHTSVIILDCLLAINIPKIEVHISNPFTREEFRHNSYISKGVNGLICGLGANSYLLAIDAMHKIV